MKRVCLTRIWSGRVYILVLVMCLGLLMAPSAHGRCGTPIGLPAGGLLGDVNCDGVVNILDIQAAISQALGFADETSEADVTESGRVDILDVQNLIATVLGAGGLVQTVTADVPQLAPKNVNESPENSITERVIAVSNEGLFAEGVVDPETGRVELELTVKTGWSLGLVVETEEGAEVLVGTVQFPIEDTLSSTLPLPTLSMGTNLDLGLLPFDGDTPAVIGQDVRNLLAEIVPPIDVRDATGDGIPDFLLPLIEYLEQMPEIAQQGNTAGLRSSIAECVQETVPEEIRPSLVDSNDNGIPDVFESLVSCIRKAVTEWSVDREVPNNNIPDPTPPELVDDVMDAITEKLPEYMSGLGSPLLVDSDGNGIPDVVEDHLSLLGVPTVMDNSGNGIPNFAELTENNIPTILDPEARICGLDTDGDGIPDEFDIDHNNSGIPNYADPDYPCEGCPECS